MAFYIKISDPKSYSERTKSTLILNLIVFIIIGFVVTLSSNWKYGLVIGLFVLIVQVIKSLRWDNFFITLIKIDGGEIEITYKQKNDQHILSGSREDFLFKKEIAFSRTRTTYLAVYYRNQLKIKQFEVGDWNEAKFDEVLLNVT